VPQQHNTYGTSIDRTISIKLCK